MCVVIFTNPAALKGKLKILKKNNNSILSKSINKKKAVSILIKFLKNAL